MEYSAVSPFSCRIESSIFCNDPLGKVGLAYGALKLSALHFRPVDHFVSHIFEISRKNSIISIINFISSRSFNLNLFRAWCDPWRFLVCTIAKWFLMRSEFSTVAHFFIIMSFPHTLRTQLLHLPWWSWLAWSCQVTADGSILKDHVRILLMVTVIIWLVQISWLLEYLTTSDLSKQFVYIHSNFMIMSYQLSKNLVVYSWGYK